MPKTQAKKPTAKKNPLGSKKSVEKKPEPKSEAVVLYPELAFKAARGEKAITYAQAQELLGWEEETESTKFGEAYLLTDAHGKKIRCYNNCTNRPLDMSNVRSLQQEHLRKRWEFTGEPLIIGKTGKVLNGQHSLIAFILAVQVWRSHPEKWSDWETEPTMEKCIVFGIEETDRVINCIDTAKPRSLADALYRSYFQDKKIRDRKHLARMADYAMRLIWDRTGAKQDPYAPIRTHSESLAFFDNHPRLLQCVEHIFTENEEGGIAKYISPGYAAGLNFLMACGAADLTTYKSASVPNEEMLTWELWDEAQEFWTLLAQADKRFAAVKDALIRLANRDQGASIHERRSLLIKAWLQYCEGKPVTEKGIALHHTTDEDGIQHLAECPIVGGLDVGGSQADPHDDEDETDLELPEETENEDSEPEPEPPKKAPVKKSGKPQPFAKGDHVWVVEGEDGSAWSGTITDLAKETARVRADKGFAGGGKEFDVDRTRLRRESPE